MPVTDERARLLLTEYFDFRSAAFPASHGYVTRMPAPTAFAPPDGELVLAVDDAGAAYGCGAIRRLSDDVLGDPPRSVWEVKHLWVREGHRGNKSGRALLAELERRARAFGAEVLVLDTHVSLVAANALYVSAGYEAIPPYNDNSNATTWYRKTLR